MRLELGSPAACSDGVFGALVDIVVDPQTRTVTQLVVEPHHRHWMARLVPIALVSTDPACKGLRLACTTAEARRLEAVQRSAFVALGEELEIDDPDWDVGAGSVLVQPYYGSDAPPSHDALATATYDRIPKGEVEIRRSSTVTSADGHRLGHVDGFLVDDDEQITHVLLEQGHLWGRREVTIPIGDVAGVRPDAITLGLTKEAVGSLEPVAVRRWR
jgi:sporulation protein YlmC with PRC-barrel domain